MLSAFLCCQAFGGAFGFDHVTINEPALMRAINPDEFKEKERAKVRALGGFAPAAFPIYLKWLTDEPPHPELDIARVLSMVRQAEGDRSAFRPHAVRLLAHEHQSVSDAAVRLLREIGTADDAAAVAGQLQRWLDDLSQFFTIFDTLAVIGTEKEIAVIEAGRKAGWLKNHPRVWAKADECAKAIREQVAKKDKDLKAGPPDKKK